jgi:hypothetical protein
MTPRAVVRMVAISALPLALSAGAVAAAAATAPTATATATPFTVSDTSLNYGDPLFVTGTVGPERAGQPVTLEYAERTGRWHTVATTVAGADGAYALRARVSRSGSARVAVGGAPVARAGAVAPPPAASIARTDSRTVTVHAAIVASRFKRNGTTGNPTTIKGRLRPGVAKRVVRLQALRHGHWGNVGSGRTSRSGRFAIRYVPSRTGLELLRVVFRGDRANTGAKAAAGRIETWRWSFASRYDIYGGAVACGGSLGYNDMTVAHKTLPCGTHVKILYHGRTANAVVRDRGPYVGGREFDLAGAVARKLHFDGIGSIQVQVGS